MDKIDESRQQSLKGCYSVLSERYKEALEYFDKAIVLNPLNADAYNGRGVAKIRLGLIEDGYKDLDEAIRLNPDLE